MATLAYGHTPIAISSSWHYAVNSTIDDANFVHQVAYMSQSIEVMITIEGPQSGIGPRTLQPTRQAC